MPSKRIGQGIGESVGFLATSGSSAAATPTSPPAGRQAAPNQISRAPRYACITHLVTRASRPRHARRHASRPRCDPRHTPLRARPGPLSRPDQLDSRRLKLHYGSLHTAGRPSVRRSVCPSAFSHTRPNSGKSPHFPCAAGDADGQTDRTDRSPCHVAARVSSAPPCSVCASPLSGGKAREGPSGGPHTKTAILAFSSPLSRSRSGAMA